MLLNSPVVIVEGGAMSPFTVARKRKSITWDTTEGEEQAGWSQKPREKLVRVATQLPWWRNG